MHISETVLKIEKFFKKPCGPLPKIAAEWLAGHFEKRLSDRPPYFGDVLILAPTRFAARNIQRRFAETLAARGVRAFAGFKIETMESVLENAAARIKTLNAAESLSIWLEVLANADRGKCYGLFPNGQPGRDNFINIARQVSELQAALAENAHTIGSAADALGEKADGRWKSLAYLEEEFFKRAQEAGKAPRFSALIEAAKNPGEMKYSEIAILGNPDIAGLVRTLLEAAQTESGAKISMLVFGEDESLFDEYGRPVPEKYSEKDLHIDAGDISTYADVPGEIRALGSLAQKYLPNAESILSIACDQENNAALFAARLADFGVKATTLTPDTLQKTSLYSLVKSLSAFFRQQTFANFLGLLKNPHVMDFAEKLSGKGVSAILSDADFILKEAVPETAEQAAKTISGRAGKSSAFAGAAYLADLISMFLNAAEEIDAARDKPECIKDAVLRFAQIPPDENERRAAEVFENSTAEIAAAQTAAKMKFEAAEIFELALAAIEGVNIETERDPEAIALQDWIEIFWADTPHVALADMNDGIVPLANRDGPFLNDTMREILGLRCQRLRQARDAYMLETLYESRKRGGMACSVCVPLTNLKSDPTVPSRILFQTDRLAERVEKLFAAPKDSSAKPHANYPWKLRAPNVDFPKKLSATKINAYLKSPWDFYLKYVLKAEPFDQQKNELDAAQMGEIFHAVFDSFAHSALRDSDNGGEISSWLLKKLDEISLERFGKKPRAQIRIQLFGLAQRLSASAYAQAEHRSAGWKISKAELPFSFDFEGWKISGRFDRIDVSERDGSVLIIDYKTFDKAEAGCTKNNHVKEKTDRKSGEVLERTWLNLQMPLYLRAARQIWPDKKISCAYFAAPKDTSRTIIDVWDDLGCAYESAMEKLEEVVEKIEAREFSPDKKPEFDNYADVFRLDFGTLKKLVEFEK